MNKSVFHTTLFEFIEKEYPATQSYPIEDPSLLKSWGLDPKIYRSLPRASFHKELGIEEVKPPYCDIKELTNISSPLKKEINPNFLNPY